LGEQLGFVAEDNRNTFGSQVSIILQVGFHVNPLPTSDAVREQKKIPEDLFSSVFKI